MVHLLSAVFKGVAMLSQGSIHCRQELINLISYVNRGGHRAMSECSKYQLLLRTDYLRLREKNDHLYIYSHILSYIALRESSQLYILTPKILVPSSVLTAVVRQSLPAKQWLTESRRVSTVKCENSCLVEYSDAVVRQLLPAKQWLTETLRVLYYQFVM
jgi:hypothetical protein